MARVYNFSAGPAALPAEVLDVVREDIPDWGGTGMSVMEVSHRGKEFVELAARCEANLRDLLAIPDDYDVLWIQGGATLQMAMAPLNLTGPEDCADYVVTGRWGKKAAQEAGKFCTVNIAADSSGENFTGIPEESGWQLTDDAAYLHITSNETIAGVEFHFVPQSESPIVQNRGNLVSLLPN